MVLPEQQLQEVSEINNKKIKLRLREHWKQFKQEGIFLSQCYS